MKDINQQKHLLFPLLVIKPKILNIIQTRKNISIDKIILGKLTQKVNTLEGLDQAELEEKLNLSLKVLPPEKDVPGLMSSFRLVAQEAGLTLKSIDTNPGKFKRDFIDWLKNYKGREFEKFKD